MILSQELTPERFEILMSDISLDIIRKCYSSMEVFGGLIAPLFYEATEPDHVTKLQKYILDNFESILLGFRGRLLLLLPKLAAQQTPFTLAFIYKLHQELIKAILNQSSDPDNETRRVTATCLSLLLKNFRTPFLRYAMEIIMFNSDSDNEERLFSRLPADLKNFRWITVGNPTMYNHDEFASNGRSILSESLRQALLDQRFEEFIKEMGFGNCIAINPLFGV